MKLSRHIDRLEMADGKAGAPPLARLQLTLRGPKAQKRIPLTGVNLQMPIREFQVR